MHTISRGGRFCLPSDGLQVQERLAEVRSYLLRALRPSADLNYGRSVERANVMRTFADSHLFTEHLPDLCESPVEDLFELR